MATRDQVLKVLDDALGLKGRSRTFNETTPLLGSVAELDSMAVLAVITGLEEAFSFTAEDDELSGELFATVGSLVRYVESKTGA